MMPAPVIELWGDIRVVRDDLLAGGTKRRVLEPYMRSIGADAYVYASPAYGYAQIALAIAAQALGVRALIFTAARKVLHPLTQAARDHGAHIFRIPYGYMSHCKAKARAYCEATGAHLLPFGLDAPEIIRRLAAIAGGIKPAPAEVWAAAGSGVLSRALQTAWPNAVHCAVQIGAVPNVDRAVLYRAPERFERPAKHPPPFPSCANYDAKAWQFIAAHARPGALYWNCA